MSQTNETRRGELQQQVISEGVVHHHFQVTDDVMKAVNALFCDSEKPFFLERFFDTPDFFLLRNDVFVTMRLDRSRKEEVTWILKQTVPLISSRNGVHFTITSGKQPILAALKALFEEKERVWNSAWTEIQHVVECCLCAFETVRLAIEGYEEVWVDVSHWHAYGIEGKYAVLTASMSASFDYKALSAMFESDDRNGLLHYTPSKVIACLVHVRWNGCLGLLKEKSHCIEAKEIVDSYLANSDRFDSLHKFAPYPDFQ